MECVTINVLINILLLIMIIANFVYMIWGTISIYKSDKKYRKIKNCLICKVYVRGFI